MNNSSTNSLGNLILDSKLILATNIKVYNLKMIRCGSYTQLYYYPKIKSIKTNEKDNSELNLLKNDTEYQKRKSSNLKQGHEIELKNIIRSKLKCQRIAKSNMEHWKSFVTLTFKDNITDKNIADKRFKNYIDKVRRIKRDFKYLCVTEYQKRGAIHYHLLTNIECDSKLIPKRDLKKLWNSSKKEYEKLEYYDLKYWLDGYSSAKPITRDEDTEKKIIGYIAKYMTKDIDDRLFNKQRYLYSRNLNIPSVSYIDLENRVDYEFFIKKIQDQELIYQNEYINPYDKSKVTFLELK